MFGTFRFKLNVNDYLQMLGGLDHNILDLEGLEGVEEDEALTMEAGAEESLLNDPDLNAELQALDIGNGDLE